MAENKRPQGSNLIDNNNNNHSNHNNNGGGNGNRAGTNRSEKHVDFTSLVSRKGKGSRSSPMPMATRPHNVLEDRDREMEDLAMVVDTQRMQLISPPPEEMLRRNQRLSGQFTPSLLADPSPGPGFTTKRKRTTLQQGSASSSALARDVDATSDLDSPMAEPSEPEIQPAVEATPNPKPRKQGRHARMASMGSPTRASFGSPSTGSTADNSLKRTKDLNTTPSKPKTILAQSPHTKNPDADWIPPVPSLALSAKPTRRAALSARSSRRSATPIPHYEPPTDVFTPPRVVYMSPAPRTETRGKTRTPTTTAKAKKGKGKTNLRVVTTQVKQELPDDIDLAAPMPPPSPSDDPLLLSGPPEPPVESSPLRRVVRRREASVQVEVESFNDVLPPSSPEPPLDSEDVQAVHAFDWDREADGSMETEDSMMRLDDPHDAEIEPVRLFDLEDMQVGSGDAGLWSDSDDDEVVQNQGKPKDKEQDDVVEGEGEFTGRWRMMKIRTKQDPPSSSTRGRMELWGRPISPFPKVKKLTFLGEEDEEIAQEASSVDEVPQEPEEVEQPDVAQERDEEEEEEEVQRMSVEPEEPVSPGEALQEDEDEEEEREVRQMSVEFDDEEEQDTSNQEIRLPEELTRQPSPDRRSSNILAFPSLESPEAGPSNYSLKPIPSTVSFQPNDDLVDEDCQMLDVPPERQDVLDDEEEDSSSDTDNEPGLVKITSADPRAAARAAAILKQHDYDCYTKIVRKKKRQSEPYQRRASLSGVRDLAKENRRRDLADAGISKSTDTRRRRSTLGMGVIGDRVFIPGTPVMTLPELLKEAEMEVGLELEHDHQSPARPSQVWSALASLEGSGQRDPYKTPLPDKYKVRLSTLDSYTAGPRNSEHDAGNRAWTKEDWKQLDACFTDERLDLGATIEGAPEGTLAPVEMVDIAAVVDRFITFIGGEEMVENCGDKWSRDNLVDRTRALQRKQRAGNVAHPTTPRSVAFAFSPSVSSTGTEDVLGGKRRMPSMEVPDFTPLGRRAGPPPRKSRPPVLPPPVVHEAPFSNLPVEKAEGRPSKRIPPTLLAPRYSHLLEEAISINEEAISINQPGKLRQATAYPSPEVDHEQDIGNTFNNLEPPSAQDDVSQDSDSDKDPEAMTKPASPVTAANPPNTTIRKRVKGFLFSYLPTLSKTSASLPLRKATVRQPGLPLPPLDILEKPRGPVTTPARLPLPKPKHPKDLVHLNPAPAPPPSALPQPSKPRRLVELHHLPPPPEKPVVSLSIPRPRRSSGSSVKDLVKGFEEMQKAESKVGCNGLQRVQSIGELRKTDTRPRWKP
ncbi:hypothetical protein GALMADRAFT_283159 [Galerina marginata CBS 339.88]|uniref:Uncharacterized protein n=1 Tax=Galerina marginata (strain CBS 339.88) TaxID=685588 RepID=A0A067SLB2_GALM3|nr:hypothetical protein GALMADRAFT_283159 [Galerina marginata CBS 339.88]